MKKSLYAITALALIIVGCAKEDVKENTGNKALVTYTFTASIEKDTNVKGIVNNDGHFEWKVGDQLALVDNDGKLNNNFEVIAVSDDKFTATISGEGVEGAHFVTAIFPREAAVSGQTRQVEFGHGDGAPVMIADIEGVANEGTIKFVHAGAVINLSFTGVPSSVTKLVFTPNASINSKYNVTTIDYDTPANNAVSAASGTLSSIEVLVTVSEGNVSVSMGVPATTYTGGFVVTLDNADGRHIFKKTSSKNVALTRAKYVKGGEANAIPYVAPTEFSVKTVSESKYWDRNGVRMIQTGVNTYAVQMNCDGGTDIYMHDVYNTEDATSKIGHVDGGGFYEISWDSSTCSGGPDYRDITRDMPFNNGGYPTNNMCIRGDFFENWDDVTHTFTYNGNMSWVLEGLSIASGGTYQFKIAKAQSDWAFQAGNKVFGTSLYGAINNDHNDNASITLEKGTYNVYLNATSNYNYNIMFEKQ